METLIESFKELGPFGTLLGVFVFGVYRLGQYFTRELERKDLRMYELHSKIMETNVQQTAVLNDLHEKINRNHDEVIQRINALAPHR